MNLGDTADLGEMLAKLDEAVEALEYADKHPALTVPAGVTGKLTGLRNLAQIIRDGRTRGDTDDKIRRRLLDQLRKD